MTLFFIIIICLFTSGVVSPRIGRFVIALLALLALLSCFTDNPVYAAEPDSDKEVRITCLILALFTGFLMFTVIDGC